MIRKESREFQVFVKPVGPECNLRCSYCYYTGKESLFPGKARRLMSDTTLEKYIIQHIRASGENVIFFSWHGGEPLLAGIDFYRKAIALQNRYKPEGAVIVNGIQTNGTLLDSQWCKFLRDEKIVVGLSIDGPEEFHDRFRKARDNRGSFSQVMKGLNLLKRYGIVPEILCVVNAENVKFPYAVYDYLKQTGAKFITFLPLVEQDPLSPSVVSDRTVPSDSFGNFLCAVFDEWIEKDIGEIKIQIFEEAARTAFNQEHTLCIFKENCGGVPVIEHTGDFYSCDHYVNERYHLGNISENSLAYYLGSQRQREFGQVKSLTLPQYCVSCTVREMCNGECPKNRFISAPDGEPGLNYLCSGYKHFFNHIRPFVEAIAEAWKNQK